mmetsp:Transcript_8377/g.14969  ORF Transcript_8377/g.14969 Transcript_8377/m.14969 type:complete len:98 (+) Transcript_8377:360-653(+)
MGFYKALNGGDKPYRYSLLRFLLKFISPFRNRLKDNAKRAKSAGFEGNFKGEGLQVGGLFVMQKGGGMQYAFQEAELGDHAPLPDVMSAAKAAKGLG